MFTLIVWLAWFLVIWHVIIPVALFAAMLAWHCVRESPFVTIGFLAMLAFFLLMAGAR